ncbi:MAG: hypothetical protein NTZ24_03325, partial [Deltaproteobacteria bacterium]|nr:hypothetical protein [Deltaproteobacteria bacterium]
MFAGHDSSIQPCASCSGAYVTAYVERDVRQLIKIQELETFQRFVRLCAGLMPVEIKSGKTLTRDSFVGLEKWCSL